MYYERSFEKFRSNKEFYKDYLDLDGEPGSFRDPDGTKYAIKTWFCAQGASDCRSNYVLAESRSYDGAHDVNGNFSIMLWQNGRCADDESVLAVPSNGTNSFAVSMPLEGGGFYCLDNS